MFEHVGPSRRTWASAALSVVCALALLAALPPQHARAASATLLISEFLANPAGNDSPFEYVELVATGDIDFASRPFSVVFSNNGSATANGWVAGNDLTYAFSITAGSVKRGDIVYVGGSSMTPKGTKLRTIDTARANGDRFGLPALTGVLGNGGLNADGIAVFDAEVSTLTSATVPADAVFFGAATGTAVVAGGLAGYQLPFNDRYNGGKLQPTSFLAADPGSTQAVSASGVYDTGSGAFVAPRSWTAGAPSDGVSGISVPLNEAVVASCPNALFAEPGGGATATLSASDPDGVVGAPVVVGSLPAGVTLEGATGAGGVGGTATATLRIAAGTPLGVSQVTVRFSNADATPQVVECSLTAGVVALTPRVYLPALVKP